MNAPFNVQQRTGAQEARAHNNFNARKFLGFLNTLIFVALLAAILAWAWSNRDTGFLTPKHGLGYWFGIAGASMMGMVLLYPLRKRIRFMRSWGLLPRWFRWHMVLGLLGPTLIVVHSNFEARSMNALVALVAILVVAGSGLVGRYLYVQIHRGLYGAKVEARELLSEAFSIRELIGAELEKTAGWEMHLKAFEAEALVHSTTLWGAIWHNLLLGRRERSARKNLLREFSAHLDRQAAVASWPRKVKREKARDGRARIENYFAAVRRAGNLAVYERLFSLWHVLHLPLIALLVVTALIHIVAVNMY